MHHVVSQNKFTVPTGGEFARSLHLDRLLVLVE